MSTVILSFESGISICSGFHRAVECSYRAGNVAIGRLFDELIQCSWVASVELVAIIVLSSLLPAALALGRFLAALGAASSPTAGLAMWATPPSPLPREDALSASCLTIPPTPCATGGGPSAPDKPTGGSMDG